MMVVKSTVYRKKPGELRIRFLGLPVGCVIWDNTPAGYPFKTQQVFGWTFTLRGWRRN